MKAIRDSHLETSTVKVEKKVHHLKFQHQREMNIFPGVTETTSTGRDPV